MTNELKHTLLTILCGLCAIGAVFGSFYIGAQLCLAGYSFWYMIASLYIGGAFGCLFGHLMERAIAHIR